MSKTAAFPKISIFKEDILKYSTHGLAQWWKEQIIKGENDGNI